MVKTIAEIALILKKSKKLAIFCHTQPDGDTVGSAMALCYALRNMGKHADVFCDEEIGENLREFVPQNEVCTDFPSEKYDTFVAVDSADAPRLGRFTEIFEKFPNTVVIDHHMGKPFGKYCHIADYSSTAEIILILLRELKAALDKQIATMLYIGLITDTGNFMHANTNEHSFQAAATLARRGLPLAQLSRVFFRDTTLARSKLIARAVSMIRSYFDGRFCLIYLMQADFDEFGVAKDAVKNIVDNAINIKSALVGISVIEASPNVFKVSLRGKQYDIRSIAERFGGGGHKFASGCQVSGFFEDVADKLTRFVKEKFEEDGIL